MLHSCSYSYMARYDVALTAVVRPQDAGEGRITAVTSKDSFSIYTYADDDIRASWEIGPRFIAMSLLNQGESTIKLSTDEMCYVDYQGAASRVMNAELPLAQRNVVQPVITIPAGAHTSLVVLPVCNIQGARIENLVPSYYQDYDKMLDGGPDFLGKTLKMLVPLRIGDDLREYLFIFKLNKFFPDKEFVPASGF